jgi:zinc protease
LGAQLTASVDKDEARLTLRTLSDGETRKAAIDLFTRLIAQPAFAPAAVERAKASAFNAIGLVQQNPTARLQQTLHAQVYGNHPYARPVEGNAQSLALIDAGKVRGFHQNAYTAANALLVIVGDISNDDATDLSIAISQALPQGPALVPVELAMDLTSPPGHTHLEAPYSQTLIMLAQPSVPANHPDYVALQVASLIFGGSNSSRLINELRHKRGLSYAASAFIPLWQAGGPWTISLQTAPDQQDATLALVKTLFAEWLRDGPTEEELVAVKRRLAGNLPLTSASNAQMVQQLLLMGAHDLPRNFDALVIHAQKLSRQDIKDAINRYSRADKWKVASLGPTVEQRPLSAVQP